MAENDDKKPGDVVSIDEARKKAEEQKAASDTPAEAENNVLAPVMAAIAQSLAGLADKDGVVRLQGGDNAAREKTAAVLRGIGQGLGLALADAFAKWADKMSIQVTNTSADAKPPEGPAAGSPAAGPKPDPAKDDKN